MEFNDDKVIEVLQRLPSEEPCVDYKAIPYKRNQRHEFLKDVIAMLNSEAGAGKDKFIIFGIEDRTLERIGIHRELWRDDNEWQNLLDKISPKPNVSTGCVEYDGKWYGYVFISAFNTEWVYEAAESVISDANDKVREKNIIARGQAFIRRGSKNSILLAEDRKRLLGKKYSEISFKELIFSESSAERNVLLSLAFIASWDERFVGDVEAIEKISGTDFKAFTERVRYISERNPGLLSFSNGCWKLNDHKTLLLEQAGYIFDDHIDSFFTTLDICFRDINPKYELSSEKRVFSSFYNKDKQGKYSKLLYHSMAETLAILGNNSSSLTKCTEYRITNSICHFEREFFKTSDWKIYATYADELQLFGEASPDVFLEEIRRLASEKDTAFIQFITEKGESFLSTQYGYQLGWILEKIAMLEKYFSRAMVILLSLSAIRADFLDTMAGIVLPWYPKTHAPLPVRVGVFRGLAQENDELTWKVLMKLMPRATTIANSVQSTYCLQVDAVPETVSKKDYVDASIRYIRLATELMGRNIERMSSMVSVIDDVDSSLENEILGRIQGNAVSLTQIEKAQLWNILQDFVHKHRKYADAEWALSADRLAPVERLANILVPDSSSLLSIRMFINRQFALLEEKGNYEKEEAELRSKQVAILQEAYDKAGMEGIKQFIHMIENVRLAGICSSSILKDTDIRELIVSNTDINNDEFLGGILRSISFDRIRTILEELPNAIKAKTLAILPLHDTIIEYVNRLEDNAQLLYWENVDACGWLGDGCTLIEYAVRRLNECCRTDASISILHGHLQKGGDVLDVELVVDTLIQNADKKPEKAHNVYEIQELIKWLQERKADKDRMMIIEWKYLAFLREDEGYPPINLWAEISSNPDSFMYILNTMTGKERAADWTDEDISKIEKHCYHLLESWKRMPGLNVTGKINKDALNDWFSAVKEQSTRNGIEKQAMLYFGKVAFYAPADDDGFFIDKKVATYLQDDKEGSILSGYQSEAINSRGIHTIDSTGEAEFRIEDQYMTKARAADEIGLFRFANTLRSIAESFHEEGLRNKQLG